MRNTNSPSDLDLVTAISLAVLLTLLALDIDFFYCDQVVPTMAICFISSVMLVFSASCSSRFGLLMIKIVYF